MIHLKRKSGWTFNTSYGASYGVAMAVSSTTDLILTSPQGVDFLSFNSREAWALVLENHSFSMCLAAL